MARKVAAKPMEFKDAVVVVLLLLALVWLVYLNISIYKKERIAQLAAKDTAAQLSSLQARQTTLQQSVSELSTERGQEQTLRDTFGVARPGEEVIIVVPPKVATTTPPETFWQKYFGWLDFWQGWQL